MRKILVAFLITGFVSSWAADAAPEVPPAEQPAEAAPEAPKEAVDVLALIHEFAKPKGITPETVGAGGFRAVLLGTPSTPELEKFVQMGCDALTRLEVWTGRPKVFVAAPGSPQTLRYMVLIKDEGVFNEWVDFGRSKGVIKPPEASGDLAKKLKGFAMPGAMISTADRLANIGGNFAVYSAACVSLDQIAAAQGRRRLPAWLREGLSSELQRAIAGAPRCTTISYQASDTKESNTENWMADVKVILRETKPGGRALTAEQVVNSSTDMISGSTYRQMWSVCTFLRVISEGKGKTKGKNGNPLWSVIESTAKDGVSMPAITAAYGIKPAEFDAAWRSWANTAKAPATK